MKTTQLILILAAAFAACNAALACDDPAVGGRGHDAPAAQHQTSAEHQSNTEAANH
ncbi:hypothetical protein [Burkholderia multivorans]|uniref:hypothetical protein n=1 Tax=Burkholderia multivorans TaxID=87883 RepID=UPI0015E297A8|nr:hypothetical protein [Burkholderia multivorans]MCO1366476.1 hypothetical protein [Burkholderia multivorans]MCO1376085.1 hypothetical protein [Burkholderia multivorans]UQP21099.1 hypothetical protein L0Y98_07070 [Burkholderia multivorans]UQP89068.1 hypothetical protein L0Y91_07070 [Burkholderia multivorans]